MSFGRKNSVLFLVVLWTVAFLVGRSVQDPPRPTDHTDNPSNPSGSTRTVHGRYRTTQNATRTRRTEKPNIVLIITDDQDVELGSLNYMPKAARWLRDAGATFSNAFVTTPMCCPSRSSLLTGMYVHNHFTYTNNDNCSSEQWRQTHEMRNFGTYLSDAGYRTGYFGKYLNEYTGAYIPPGWTEWMGLIRNTRFYNYTLNYNGKKIKHEDDYYKDYLTDVIANNSIRFLQESKQYFPNRPVAMMLSMPAPHGPEDSAPPYQRMFFDVKSHRTPSWNFAPNPDKQWLLQYTGKMTPIQIAFTDLLHTKRLQTLQSVDDAVQKVCQSLEAIGELDNTYIIYTSDHGYHLGQYGLVKGKAMPYEFDIRVPFYIRGPRINPGTRMPSIVLNLDIAPTLLDMAGVPAPEHMDGSSILKLFDSQSESLPGASSVRRRRVWRDTFLVERGKLTVKKLKVQEKLEARVNRLVVTKDQRLEEECRKPQYQSPCKAGQQWECRQNEQGRLRVYKCRGENSSSNAVPTTTQITNQVRCNCPPGTVQERPMNANEMRRQLDFLQQHVNKPAKMTEPRFIAERFRRDARPTAVQPTGTTESMFFNDTFFELPDTEMPQSWNANDDVTDPLDKLVTDPSLVSHSTVTLSNLSWLRVQDDEGDLAIPCRLSSNGSVVCERYVYTSHSDWQTQKEKIERILNDYRQRLSTLKAIHKYLMQSQPTAANRSADGKQSYISSTASTMDTSTATATTAEMLDRLRDTDETVGESRSVDESVYKFVDEDDCVCEETHSDSGNAGRRNTNNADENRRLQSLARRVATQDERVKNRKMKIEQHRSSRRNTKTKDKRVTKATDSPFDCDSPDVSCSATELPFVAATDRQLNPWVGVDMSQFSSRRDPVCSVEGLECSRMDDDHWKVAPYWTHGPFCICPNSNNNTYWCLRTVNDTHNFLYCEFITGFISFYDMTRDPNQLRNAVHDLSFGVLHQLHNTLELMKGCKGARKCNERHRVSGFDADDRANWKNIRHTSSTNKVNDQMDSTQQRWLRARTLRHGRS